MKLETNKILCLSCANIFLDEKKDELVCNICGNKIDRKQYESLIDYSYDAASYGYLYRKEYQSQIVKGEPARLYWISPDEIIIYCALAALSGVIGNATYDVAKYLIQKIKKEYDKSYPSESEKIFKSDEEISLFLQYLEDYYQGLKGVDFVVRKMIEIEIRADVHIPDDYLKQPKKSRIKKLMEIFRRNKKKQSPWELNDLSPADFDNLWISVKEKRMIKNKSTPRKKPKSKNKETKVTKSKKSPSK